jgi:hypothetical protein
MKRTKISIKKTILKKIEFRHKQIKFIENKGLKKMDELDKARIYGDGNRPINVSLLTRHEMRIGNQIKKNEYSKKVFVDYDVVICIPSYERYKKVRRLIKQFYEQPTQFTFKIIILNDGSNSSRYDELITEFPEIIYIKNDKSNGKALHWYCYNQMWEYLKDIKCHAVLQMDDDFILCEKFLNTIVNIFFYEKENNNNVMAIAPHLWSFKKNCEFERWWLRKDFVDGIALIDDAVIKVMQYKMKPVDVEAVSKPGVPVRAWSQISEAIVNMGGIIYRTPDSLVYHDGNDDSKLHGDVRNDNKGGVYTQKYIGKL